MSLSVFMPGTLAKAPHSAKPVAIAALARGVRNFHWTETEPDPILRASPQWLEAPMSCCDENTARVPAIDVTRRSLFKGAALVASVIPAALPGHAEAQQKRIKLAYCSQLLCGVPYEVARTAGHFKNHGLDIELIYTRGGNAAMQALMGGAVDYAATALDVAIQAYANVGAKIRRFAVTGRLPLFAVVTAPGTAARIQSIKDLEGKSVGVSALGNADHALTLFLLKQAGADAQKVQFATMGVNLLEALRQGQIDAGVVQEPALTLLKRANARVLVNAMDLEDAKHYLGGSFEFMGVAVRADEVEQRRPEMVALAKSLADALKGLRGMTGDQMAASLPKEMTTGLDLKDFADILQRHRDALYPETVDIDLDAAKRVEQALVVGGLVKPGTSISGLHDTSIAGG
jgi:NitT/TauT family transport system substrate-binding protein